MRTCVIPGIFVLLLVSVVSFGQRQLWTTGTAYTLGHKDFQISLLQPSSYGLSSSIEIAVQPLLLYHNPNFYLKKAWIKKKRFVLSTGHGLQYPRQLYRLIGDMEVLDGLDQNSTIPPVFSFRNELLFSLGFGESDCPAFTREEFNRTNTFVGPTTILTFKLGLANAFKAGDLFPVIVKPLVYQRTAYFNNDLAPYLGVDLDGRWFTNTDYCLDFDYFMLGNGHYALEHKGLVKWFAGKRFFHIAAGYHISLVQTPDGAKFFAMPAVDLLWIMRRNKIELGLFGKKMF